MKEIVRRNPSADFVSRNVDMYWPYGYLMERIDSHQKIIQLFSDEKNMAKSPEVMKIDFQNLIQKFKFENAFRGTLCASTLSDNPVRRSFINNPLFDKSLINEIMDMLYLDNSSNKKRKTISN